MVTRAWDWEKRLHRYVGETQPVPFAYGSQDCALWALGAVDAMCDSALAAEFTAQYFTLDGAVAIFAARGWATMTDAATALIGPAHRHVSHVRRGDLAIRAPELPDDPLGIPFVMGDGVIWGPTATGVRAYPVGALRKMPGVVGIRVG